MYINKDKLGKSYKGLSGFLKGILFKVTFVSEDTNTIHVHTYTRDMIIKSGDMSDVEVEEIAAPTN